MADDLKIVIKAVLDEQDIKNQSKGIKGVEIPGRIIIDKADIKKQIDSIAGESSKFGNKFTIKYGVDKTHFVKQFRDAGEQAKKEVEKALGSSGSPVKINVQVNESAIAKVQERMKGLGFDDTAITKATQALKEQQITVTDISQGYRTINRQQQELAALTIKGVDAEGNLYNITERYNISKKKSLETQTKITSKLNEQGEIVNKMATKLRTKDTGTIRAEETEVLNKFISDINKAGLYSGELKNTTDALRTSLENAFTQPAINEFLDNLGIAEKRFKYLRAEAERTASSPVSKIDARTDSLTKTLAYQGMGAETAGVTALRNEITSLVGEYGRLKVSMDGLDPSSAEFQNLATQVDALDTRFKSATQAAKVFDGSFGSNTKLAGVNELIKKAKSSLDELEVKWSKFQKNPALLSEFEKLRDAAKDLDATNLQNFNKQLAAFKTNVRAAGADTRTFGDELKNALAKFGIWISASTIFMQAWRGIRQMVDSVKELDAALVEFNKVADLSNAELNKFVDRAFDAGKALGRTGTEVIQASAIFKQAGYDVEESLSLSNSALVMKNVSENIDSTASAASDLISVLKGFDMAVTDSMSIVDMINNVSNNLPVSFGAIDEGLTRVSGTLAQTGSSIQETIGLLTGGFASLRNMEKVSAGLIQISQRLRGIGTDGEAIDGLAPKLQSMFKEIAGVDIADTNGELRSTFDIISDLSKVADDLSTKERQLLFEKASGTRQVAVLNAIVSNWDDVSKAVDKATNSTGSAMQENEKFLDSIQGKTNQLASSFQLLANNTIQSGFIKGLLDFANAIVQVVDKIGLLPSLLVGLSTFTTVFSGNKFSGAISGMVKALVKMPKGLVNTVKMFAEARKATLSFGDSLKYAGVTASATQFAILGVVAALTLIKSGFDAYTKSLVDQEQKAKELSDAWKETRDSLTSNKDAIDGIGADFERLGKGVDSFGNNISLTSDEFDRYHEITNQIAGMFPELVNGFDEQGNAILNVKGNVEELTAAYEKQKVAAYDAILQGAGTVFGQSRRTTNDSSDIFGTADTGAFQQIEMASKLIEELSAMKKEGRSSFTAPFGTMLQGDAARAGKNAFQDVQVGSGVVFGGSGKFSQYTINPDQIDSSIKQLSAYHRILIAQSRSAAREVTPIIEAYLYGDTDFESLSKDGQALIMNVVGNLDPEYILKHKNVPSLMNSVFADIMEGFGEKPELLEKSLSTIAKSDEFRVGKISVDEYAQSIAQLKAELATAGVKGNIADSVIDMVSVDNVDQLVENVKLKLRDEFDSNVGTMSLGQLKIAAGLEIEDGALLSWQQLLDLINKTSAALSSLSIGERVDAIANAATIANTAFGEQAYSASITREQYGKLVESGEEYAKVVDNSNGYLSINKQKLDALILSKRNEEKANIAISKAASLTKFDENAKDLAETTLAIKLLADEKVALGDEYDSINDKLREQHDALTTSQDQIRDEIVAYDLLASELDYATSAYKRWLDAKSGPEAGDAYDELSVAKKAIEEGLANGKVGTNKFKAAEALLIPEEVSAQGRAAISKYVKSLSGYLTEDSKGVTKFIKDLTAKGFMEKAADGTYSTTAKSNIEDIAKSLNITKEATEFMFTALKDYGWEVALVDGVYDSTAATQEYTDAVTKLDEAKRLLAEAKTSGAGIGEVAKLEQGVTDAQAAVDNLNQTEIKPPVTIEEQLLAEVAKLQGAVDLLLVSVPAEFDIDVTAELAVIQSALTADKTLIATAKLTGDPEALNAQLDLLKSDKNADGTPKTPIQLQFDALRTALYESEIAIIKADIAEVEGATPTVTPKTDPSTFNTEMTALQGAAYTATIVIDGNADEFKKKAEEARLWWSQQKLNGDPPDSVLFGDGTQVPQSENDALLIKLHEQDGAPSGEYSGGVLVKDYLETKETIESNPITPRIDTDTEEFDEVRGAFKRITQDNLESERSNYESVDSWANYLQGKIAEIEERKKLYEKVGIELSPGNLGALDAYKEALDEIIAPKVIPIDAKTSDATNKVDNLIDDINSREATIDVKVNAGGTPWEREKYAKGTKRAKKGVALTGEEGVETVLTKDGFYTVGHNGPELVNLKGGEEILNDDETKKIFGNSKKRIAGQSFATGTNIFSSIINGLKAVAKKIVDSAKKVTSTKSTSATGTGKAPTSTKSSNKSGGGSSSASKAETEKAKEEIKNDFEDWIPRLLDNVRKQTDKFIASSEKQVTYAAQNSELDKAIGNNNNLINVNRQANSRYLQQAAQVATSGGLSSDIISKIQNGAIDINLYDENTRKVISDYQTWYDLAQKTLDTITDIENEQRKLAMSKLDNIQTYYENRNSMYGNRIDIASSTLELGQSTGRETTRSDYAGMLNDVNAQLGILREERAEYERTFTALVTSGVIKEGSTDWYNYTARIQEMDKSIIQASQSLDQFNDMADAIAVNNLNVAIRYLNTVQSTLESVQGLRQAQGRTLDTIDYEQLISVGMQQISVLEGQNAELTSQQEGLDVLSTAYQDIQGQIEGNLNSIWNIKTSQEGWNDAITDLNISRLQRANEQYNRQLDTMKAMEELEKAKQRRNLVYREGRGFGYETDPVDLLEAQRKVDQVNVDNLITALEDSKADDNVYDTAGNLLGKLFTGLDGVDFGSYAASALGGNENSTLLANAIKAIDWNSIKNAAAGTNNVEFSGGINLYGVNDVAALANGIQNFLGSYITQGLFDNV